MRYCCARGSPACSRTPASRSPGAAATRMHCFGWSRLAWQALDLALVDQPVHVAEERLGSPRRPHDALHLRGLVAGVPKRMRRSRRHGHRFARPHRTPLPVYAYLQRPVDHLKGVVAVRVHMDVWPGLPSVVPVRGFEDLARRLLSAPRDLPPHPHRGMEVELTGGAG